MLEFEGLKVSSRSDGKDPWGHYLPISYNSKAHTIEWLLKKLKSWKEDDGYDEIQLGEKAYELLKNYLTPTYEELDQALTLFCKCYAPHAKGGYFLDELGPKVYGLSPEELKKAVIDRVKSLND